MGFFDQGELDKAKEKLENRKEFKKSSYLGTGRYYLKLTKAKIDEITKPGKRKGTKYFAAEFEVLKVIEASKEENAPVIQVGDLVSLYKEGGYAGEQALELVTALYGGVPSLEDADKFVDPESNHLIGLPVEFNRFRETYTGSDGEEKSYIPLGCTGPLTKQQVKDEGYDIDKDILALLD